MAKVLEAAAAGGVKKEEDTSVSWGGEGWQGFSMRPKIWGESTRPLGQSRLNETVLHDEDGMLE